MLSLINEVEAVDFNHSANKSSLPKSFIDNILLQTNKNHSLIYFEYGNYTKGISSVQLDNYVSSYNLTANLTIPLNLRGLYRGFLLDSETPSMIILYFDLCIPLTVSIIWFFRINCSLNWR